MLPLYIMDLVFTKYSKDVCIMHISNRTEHHTGVILFHNELNIGPSFIDKKIKMQSKVMEKKICKWTTCTLKITTR